MAALPVVAMVRAMSPPRALSCKKTIRFILSRYAGSRPLATARRGGVAPGYAQDAQPL